MKSTKTHPGEKLQVTFVALPQTVADPTSGVKSRISWSSCSVFPTGKNTSEAFSDLSRSNADMGSKCAICFFGYFETQKPHSLASTKNEEYLHCSSLSSYSGSLLNDLLSASLSSHRGTEVHAQKQSEG